MDGNVAVPKRGLAMAAVLDEWIADVSSLDEQRAALLREELAREKEAVQQLIVGMAGMAKAGQHNVKQSKA
jgi:hypothetical protein